MTATTTRTGARRHRALSDQAVRVLRAAADPKRKPKDLGPLGAAAHGSWKEMCDALGALELRFFVRVEGASVKVTGRGLSALAHPAYARLGRD